MSEEFIILGEDGKMIVTIHDREAFSKLIEDFERVCRCFQRAIDDKDDKLVRQREMELRSYYYRLCGSS
jgi:hypothetical protein